MTAESPSHESASHESPSRGAPPSGLVREAASTVAVIPDEAGFALMRRYPSFRHPDHPSYLRRTEALLRSLARRHGHTEVALFDAPGYASYCARARLDPDRPASRARYGAELAARGPTLPYGGQPLGLLLPELLLGREREAAWERGTELLAAAGPCAGCGAPLSRCAFQRAAGTLSDLLRRSRPGHHHLVCSVVADAPLTAALRVELGPEGVRLAEPEALAWCTVLAAGLSGQRPGGLVQRREPPGGAPPEVRGWSLRAGRLWPLGEAQVFAAYCTHAHTREPVPPEPGVAYRAAPPLPTRSCPDG